jgi:uncharacterized protein YjbI with pentapeptide repeats
MGHLEEHSRRLVGADSVSVKISDKMMKKYTDKPAYMELARIPGIQIQLDVFDETQIDLYLLKRESEFDAPWKEVKKFLLSIYDLKDLMSRQILLSMIVDTVIEGKIDIKKETSIIGPAGLYETYTEIQLRRDTYRGEPRRFLTPDQRRYFAQATAVSMLETQSLTVSYRQVLDLIEQGIKDSRSVALPKGATPEEIATDIFVCAFLSRTIDDKFRFVHKSFMEFFVAQFLKKNLDAAFSAGNVFVASRLLDRKLPDEIRTFLALYSLLDGRLPDKIGHIINRLEDSDSEGSEALNNANNILLLVAGSSQGLKFFHGSFIGKEVSKKNWGLHRFDQCTFSNIIFADITFVECTLLKCTMLSTDFSACSLQSGAWEVTCRIVRFQQIRFLDTHLKMVLEGTVFTRCSFATTIMTLKGSSELVQSTFQHCKLGCSGDIRLDISNTGLQETSIVANDGDQTRTLSENLVEIRFANCTIERCFIFDIWVRDDQSLVEIKSAARRGTRGLVNVRLSYADRKRHNVPDSGRFEILDSGLLALFHGPRRMSAGGLLAVAGAASERQNLSDSKWAEEAAVWGRYLTRIKRGDSHLRELL